MAAQTTDISEIKLSSVLLNGNFCLVIILYEWVFKLLDSINYNNFAAFAFGVYVH